MPEVVNETNSVDHRSIWKPLRCRSIEFLAGATQLIYEATRDLRDLQRVRQAGPVEVAVSQIEDLGLPL